jgi:hypothetical protein
MCVAMFAVSLHYFFKMIYMQAVEKQMAECLNVLYGTQTCGKLS